MSFSSFFTQRNLFLPEILAENYLRCTKRTRNYVHQYVTYIKMMNIGHYNIYINIKSRFFIFYKMFQLQQAPTKYTFVYSNRLIVFI